MRILFLALVLALSGQADAEKLTSEEAAAITIANLTAQIAKLEAQLQTCEVRRAHHMDEGDELDGKTLEIKRKPAGKK